MGTARRRRRRRSAWLAWLWRCRRGRRRRWSSERARLVLRRYRNVADMLRDYIPSCVGNSCSGSGDDAITSSSSCSSGVGRESKELYAIMSMPLVNGIWLLVAWEEHHPPNPPTSISQLTMRAARLGRERGNGAWRSAPAAAQSRCDAVCRLRGRPQRTVAAPPDINRLKCANHHQNDNQG